jgi:hypothetical protein
VSKLLQNKRSDLVTPRFNEECICTLDNLTLTPIYHIRDSMTYNIVRCNYCGEEWAEYWISNRCMSASLIKTETKNGS